LHISTALNVHHGLNEARKLKYFGHVTSREKDIMLGTMPGTRQGGQRRQWLDNITQWTEMGHVDIGRSFDGSVTRKLKYFGYVTRHDSLEKDIMLGTMPGTRRQGGQR